MAVWMSRSISAGVAAWCIAGAAVFGVGIDMRCPGAFHCGSSVLLWCTCWARGVGTQGASACVTERR
eukprot:3901362-Ditylum_brightwellii.AAC.1